MDCRKCKKFDKIKSACSAPLVMNLQTSCYLKGIASSIRVLIQEQQKLVSIYSEIYEVQKQSLGKCNKIMDAEIKNIDNGEEWKTK